MSQFCRELEERGWIAIRSDRADRRKRWVRLTPRGRSAVRSMKPMWQAVERAALDLCQEAGGDLLASIQRFEQALTRRSIAERALEVDHDRIAARSPRRDPGQRA